MKSDLSELWHYNCEAFAVMMLQKAGYISLQRVVTLRYYLSVRNRFHIWDNF